MRRTEVRPFSTLINPMNIALRCRRLSRPGDIAFAALEELPYYLQTRTIVTYAQVPKYADIVDVVDLAEGQ